MNKILFFIKKIIGSHAFVMTLIALLYGMTAISPNILKNPIIFGNYIGFIIFNALIQAAEKRDSDREWQNKIDNLQNQIDKLKSK